MNETREFKELLLWKYWGAARPPRGQSHGGANIVREGADLT